MSLRLLLLLSVWLCVTACGEDNTPSKPHTATTSSVEKPHAAQAVNEQTKPSPAPFDKAKAKEMYQGQALQLVDISERQYDGGPALAISFNVPIDPDKDFSRYIQVSSKQQQVKDGAWILSENAKILYFPYVQPSQAYTVTVTSGLSAVTGASLKQNTTQTIEIRSLNPMVNFTNKGAFLPADLSSGLPVTTVNIPAVDIHFHRIRDDQLLRFLESSNVVSRDREYYELDDISRYSDLVYTGRFELPAPENRRRDYLIPVSDIEPLKQAGLYLAVMTPAGQYPYSHATTYFTITDIGLHVRSYSNNLDVYTRSLKSGEALSEAKVTLLYNDQKRNTSMDTNPQGVAHFNQPLTDVRAILVEHGGHLAILEANSPAIDLNEFKMGQRAFSNTEVFIYSPRDLYRPGENLVFSALARNHDGQPLPTQTLSAKLKKPDGQTYKEWSWSAQAAGYFEQHLQLADDVPTGRWRLQVTAPDQSTSEYLFNVEDFLPERMTLQFNNADPAPIVAGQGESFTIPVQGDYLFGAPAAGNRLTSVVNPTLARTPVEKWSGFEFGDEQEQKKLERIELDPLFLDEKGYGEINIVNQWSALQSPLSIEVIGSLYESGGRPVTRAYSALIWPSESLIGIRADFEDHQSTPDALISFELVKSNLQGALSAADVDITLISEDRNYFWSWSSDEGWHYEYNEKEYPVYSQSLHLDGATPTTLNLPVDYGHYRLEVVDTQTHIKSSYRFMAGEDWYYDWRNSQSSNAKVRPDIVTLSLDKKAYKGGDTAQLSIKPISAGPAVVMVESDKLLWLAQVDLPAEGSVLDIPIDEKWDRHDTYISVMSFSAGDKKQLKNPKRAFGLLYLPFDRTDRELKISIDAPEKIQPKQTLHAKLHVEGATQSPMYVTLAAVDSGVLNITDFVTPDPVEGFFGQRRYSADSRDNYHLLIDPSSAKDAKLAFGGDAMLKRGGAQPKNEVLIVSLFQSPVQFDAQGNATVDLEIPDFNGEVRLMALAFSDNAFGQAEKKVKIAAPIITEISRPRFMAFDDQSTLAFDVQNLSGQSESLTLRVTVTEPLLLQGDKVQVTGDSSSYETQITLDDKQKQTLSVPISALPQIATGHISLQVSTQKAGNFEREWSLSVRPAYPAITTKQMKTIQPNQTETFSLPSQEAYHASATQLSLSLSNRVDLNANQQISALLEYPYGCLEQTSSRTFPWVFADSTQAARFNFPDWDAQKRANALDSALTRIANMQLGNGGYGLWDNQSPEEHWLSAYVGDLLVSASQQGVQVSPTQYQDTLKRLTEYVRLRGNFISEHWSQNPEHYAFASKAYAAYVLARVNKISAADLRSLATNEGSNSATGLPILHMALAMKLQGDKQSAQQWVNAALYKQKKISYSQYLGDYGSLIRDKAMMIHLLLTHQMEVNQAYVMAKELNESLNHKRWLSTQERGALFLAAMSINSQTGTRWQALVNINQQAQTIDQNQVYQEQWRLDALQDPISVTAQSDTPLFAELLTIGYPSAAPKPVSNKLSISRNYYNQQGEAITPSQLQSGDMVIVHLAVSSSERTPDALVVDLLPAGLELENQNLKHAVNLDLFKIEDKSIEQLTENNQVRFQQYRDDRFIAAVDLNNYYTTHLFYIARAVTPGTYQVPPSLVEDMYRPERHGIGTSLSPIVITTAQ